MLDVPTSAHNVFVDPLFDDDMRDAGISQTSVIAGQTLMLPSEHHINLSGEVTLNYSHGIVINQNTCTWNVQPCLSGVYTLEAELVEDNKYSPVLGRYPQLLTGKISESVEPGSGWGQRKRFVNCSLGSTRLKIELLGTAEARPLVQTIKVVILNA